MIIGIVAVDRNGAIGKGGNLPWHYSSDMKFFKETTTGHACVMGHKTWQTLKKPLPNRLNIVLTRQSEIAPQDSVIVVRNVETVLAMSLTMAKDSDRELFVIGGEQIFRAFLPKIERWLVTEIPLTIEGADTFVPAEYLEGFKVVGARELEENLIVRTYDRLQT